jgi:hypothetical protein
MADIHIRNLYAYNGGASSALAERIFLWMAREAFLVGRWTVADIDADPAWDSASNILLPLTDFAVTAATPYQVTSATGGFTSSHESKMLTLFAADDNIRGIYNVLKVLDSNTLLVDPRTRAGAWPSDESSITGRIHEAARNDPLDSTASYVVMQAPAASGSNLQVRFYHNGTTEFRVQGYPLGDYLTTANGTDQGVMYHSNAAYYTRMNYYFKDPTSGLLASAHYYTSSATYTWTSGYFGELTGVVAGDTNPGFVQHLSDLAGLTNPVYMLNEVNVPASFYPMWWKRWDADDADNDKRESQPLTLRMNGGKVKTFRPMVLGENTADGGFMRGVDPRTFTHDKVSGAIDEFGTDWWYMGDHTIVPRDGVNDIRPLASSTF